MTSARGGVRIGLGVAIVFAAAVAVVVWLLVRGGMEPPHGVGPPAEPRSAPSQPAADPATPPDRAETHAITPRPFAESDPAEGAGSRGVLEIEVIGPVGKPSSQARLALFQGEKLFMARTANEAGVATMPAGEGQADLTVIPDGAPIHLTTISIEPGRRRVELPPGVAITGRVEVDGEIPKEAVRLWANATNGPMLAGAAWDALDGEVTPRVTVFPSGQFELLGLAKASEWTFNPATEGYRRDEILLDDKPVANLIAPAAGVVIKLSRMPLIRGRVVSGDPPVPVPKATCSLAASWSTGRMTMAKVAGADGRFVFTAGNVYERVKITRIDVTVRGPNNVGSKQVTLDPAPETDVDLGDLEVPSARTIAYVVRDAAGAPIEGALARFEWRVDRSTRTDAQGRGSIRIGPDVKKLFVGALHYEIAEVEVPQQDSPDPLPVVLGPATGLEVRVVAAEGALHPSVRVRLSAEVEKLFPGVGEPTGNDEIIIELGGSSNEMGSWGAEGSEFMFSPAKDGRYVVAGLQAGVPIKVDAIDATHHVLAGVVVTLGAGEWKAVELKVTKVPRSLRGRVRDAAGKPIAGAMAEIDSDSDSAGASWSGSIDSHQLTAATDAEGRFVLSGIFTNPVHFAVTKEGYSPIIQRNLALPAEGVELDLRMQAGCRMTAKVLESGGAPILELEVWAEVAGYPLFPAEELKDPGAYLFSDLPCDVQATISFDHAGRKWQRVLATKDGHVETFALPRSGKKLVVDYSEIGDGPYTLALSAPDPADGLSWVIQRATSFPRVFEVNAVPAGEYTASLRAVSLQTPAPLVAAPQAVTVLAGETTRIVFKQP